MTAATMDAIIGVPEAGERLDGQVFDGKTEAAVFPGELPADPRGGVRRRRDRARRNRRTTGASCAFARR